MRLISLLAFYDEPKELLAWHVDTLAQAGADHLVALDGRYSLFPADEDLSPADQRVLLDAACRHHGLGLTLHVPQGAWEGEPQKRTWLFALALSVAERDDWFLVCDADMGITRFTDLKTELEACDREAAVVTVHDMEAARARRLDWPEYHSMRCLFRAHPIVVGPRHCLYRSALDGHVMWQGPGDDGLAEPLDLKEQVEIEHRPNARLATRVIAKDQYYSRIHGLGVEMGQCGKDGCDRRATVRIPRNLRLVNGIPGSEVHELCEKHGALQEQFNRRWLRRHGFPENMRFNERYALS